jgi:UDP-glucose 4-epimerase
MMNGKRAILVTGVSFAWGRRLAGRLLTEPGLEIIGLDHARPDPPIHGLDFVQADIRNPALAAFLVAEAIDTVCHLKFITRDAGARPALDINVVGTMKLLGACAEAGVKRVVLKSSTAVYGAQADNAAFLGEEAPLRGGQRDNWIRDLVEIEAFCEAFRKLTPQTRLAILRFANIVSGQIDTPFSSFMTGDRALKLIGFDPLVQVIHEFDVVEALAQAVLGDAEGVFNVAAEGPMPLSRVLSLLNHPSRPSFRVRAYAQSRLATMTGGPGFERYPEWDYVRYSCVADTGRMHELGFVPKYTGAEALKALTSSQDREEAAERESAQLQDEAWLRDIIEKRRLARQAGDGPASEEP